MWRSILVPGDRGSEGGTVLADEEYKGSCRITLEKCESCCAVTCGIYGAMVHTAFADGESCLAMYEEMKRDLQEFLDTETSREEELAFYESFCNKY